MEIMPIIIVSHVLVTSLALLNLIWVYTFSVGILVTKIIAILCVIGTLMATYFVNRVLPPTDLIEWLIVFTPTVLCLLFMILLFKKSKTLTELSKYAE
jgi:hypothetical protein